MSDELAILQRVTGDLETAGIPYMVTGSIALSVYAEPRMTRDVDLVIERSEVQLRDVRLVLEAQPGLDWDYIRHWAAVLGVSALLDEVRP